MKKTFIFLLLIGFAFGKEVEWLSYQEGFKKAKKEKKLILMDIYAQWCHWCNVMENTTYRDKNVIDIIEKYYVPVRVDAEKEVEINKKYNQGGLPTTVILSPDRKILFGVGRYISPESMVKLLNYFASMSEEDIREYADRIKIRRDAKLRSFVRKLRKKNINQKLIKKTFRLVNLRFDKEYGGFSGAPKFPIKELPYFLMLYTIFDNDSKKWMVKKTLDGYGKLIDKVEGGIYRYSTTEYWTEPHYEKLLKDQADLSILFFNGYSFTKNKKYLKFANLLISFAKNKLYCKEKGFFYNSQGADIVDEKGNLLMTGEEFFIKNKEDRETIISMIGYAPKIEKSIYLSNNALMASALFYSYVYNNSEEDLKIAENILKNIEKYGWTEKGIKYSPDIDKYYLNTQVYTLEAFLNGYQVTGRYVYLLKAEKIADTLIKNFYSEKNKIFTDLNDVGLNFNRISFIDDVINLNYRAAKAFYKLNLFTGNERYKKVADRIIKVLPDKPNLSTAIAYYIYLKPPLAIHGIGKNRKEVVSKIFPVFPFYVFSHFIDITDKKRIEKLGYRKPEKEVAFICNSDICFKQVNNLDKIDDEIFSILKSYKDIR